MLAEIGDWYRIIDPVLNDERLGQRKETASTLADAWQDADQGTLLAIVSLVNELTSSTKNLSNKALAPVVDAIIVNQPSFDRKADIAANDVRICAAVALGEVLHRAKRTGVKTTGVKAAACVVSSLRFRSWSGPRAVADQLQLLLSGAQALLRIADILRRRRANEPFLQLDEVPADFSKAKEDYEAAFALLEAEILKDREELQALWWLFGGYSVLRSEKYSDIKVGAGLLAGHELSTILSPPPSLGMAALAARMVRSAFGANRSIALTKLFTEIPLDMVRSLTPSSAAAELIRHEHEVFPLLSCVIRAAEGETDAAQIVRAAGNWRPKLTIGEEQLAEQFYFENSLLELLMEV